MSRMVAILGLLSMSLAVQAAPWARHAIDDSSRGADGVRLGDINGDGRLDITTGWEEGARVRVYLQPAAGKVKDRWPAVTVGEARSPEDAMFVDFNGDGVLDVVSSCEGNTRTVFVHFAPRDQSKLLDPASWRTEAIAATVNKQQWMYAMPLDMDGQRGIDVIIGSKGKNAGIGWLESPDNPRNVAAWKYHRLRDAGWIMSLEAVDIDGDGDLDVLASDRKGDKRGVFWLENAGHSAEAVNRWRVHTIGGEDHEVMFLEYADFDGDGRQEIVVAAKPRRVLVFARADDPRKRWTADIIELQGNLGNAKAVRVTDVDLDGRADVLLSCEGATGGKSGVAWFSREQTSDAAAKSPWTMHDISGPPGTKFDRIELVDLDNDGDLDVITCEEAENLGVIWYENPAR
ncbi:MAG: VCBS repeat-containing protein [Pirellulales bacterium]